ncbi:Na+/H+ antiporter NhaA [Desulfovibrio aminophilus]|uniref:Na+/H+ antiporter NhaA n=1 Tax=Desulfovibrio aminophilus TaxID=81425 RepID=UPI003397BB1A
MRPLFRAPIDTILSPFQRFFHTSASSGLLLVTATIAALIWANSPWAGGYHALWAMPLSVGLGGAGLAKPLLLWINDGIMAMFFFVVGLEIKREFLAGELASPRQALLPIASAVGGMLVPAALFWACTQGSPHADGWGVPMATDIAFALGVLSLLGSRVPATLKIFLAAVAIVDDIGAVLVIALFYTGSIHWTFLGLSLLLLLCMAGANALGVRASGVYLVLGCALWLAFLKSGVHATVAGVLAAMAIPARPRLGGGAYIGRVRDLLEDFRRAHRTGHGMLANPRRHKILLDLRRAGRDAETPLQRLEARLHPWMALAVMPLFALANAGVDLSGDMSRALTQPLSLGILAGLLLGKPLGVALTALALTRMGLAAAPAGTTARHFLGAGCLAGIGFTMSIFIAGLAFDDPGAEALAKTAVLAASLAAGLLGWLVLRGLPEGPTEPIETTH